ncbi:MAG: glycosyltransferase family 9 protein [bacterium]
MNNQPLKILIIHTWGIGDLIMFTPALRLIRQNFHEAQIDILITDKPVSAQVLEENRTVNKIITFYWKEGSFFEKLKLISELRKEKYDWAVVTSWTNQFKGGLLAYFIGAKNRIGVYKRFKSPFYTKQAPGKESRPRRETNLALVSLMGIKAGERPEEFFEFSAEDAEFAREFVQKSPGPLDKVLIGFHPGAEPVHRYLLWPKDYFVALAKKITENYKNAVLLVFAGPGEKDICDQILAEVKENILLASDLSLKQVAALIDVCRVFVASDSGLAQVASATRTNLITIFGPSESRLFAGQGPRVKVFQAECHHPYQENRQHACLKKITPEMVFHELKKFL